jgi:hypothetical protein
LCVSLWCAICLWVCPAVPHSCSIAFLSAGHRIATLAAVAIAMDAIVFAATSHIVSKRRTANHVTIVLLLLLAASSYRQCCCCQNTAAVTAKHVFRNVSLPPRRLSRIRSLPRHLLMLLLSNFDCETKEGHWPSFCAWKKDKWEVICSHWRAVRRALLPVSDGSRHHAGLPSNRPRAVPHHDVLNVFAAVARGKATTHLFYFVANFYPLLFSPIVFVCCS